MKKIIDLLDSIVADGAISDAHLRMLVDKITVSGVNSKLKVQIDLNGRFRMHFDSYDDSGDMTDRVAECWCFPC